MVAAKIVIYILPRKVRTWVWETSSGEDIHDVTKCSKYGKMHRIIIQKNLITRRIEYCKRVCCIQLGKLDVGANDLSRYSVKDFLSGTKNTRNGNSRHMTPNLLDKFPQNEILSKWSITQVAITNSVKPWSTNEIPEALKHEQDK